MFFIYIPQVTAHGGPQPESTIEFSILNDTVAKVSAGGVIESEELGVTTVTGKAVGVDLESGYVVYSQVSTHSVCLSVGVYLCLCSCLYWYVCVCACVCMYVFAIVCLCV